ncbi:MAG: DUF1080 domain-containing protein [Prevotellaceae bacterium]|jgi:hypothetical protein|nr:DUF1080 domain-containing protein [Prevotellaceae bacterium]
MNRLHIFTACFCALLFVSKASIAQKIELFNGKDLSGWNFVVDKNSVPADSVFTVRDGLIHVKGTLGYMYSQKKYRNYILKVSWRWYGEATNSGIFLTLDEPKNPFPRAIECQLAAGKAGDMVMLGGSDLKEYKAPPEGRPAFPKIEKMNASSEKPVGEWNEAIIIVEDGKITIFINGEYQNRATSRIQSGHIGLQSEGKEIQFKNVSIVSLDGKVSQK